MSTCCRGLKIILKQNLAQYKLADPGFPVRGRQPRRGGIDSQGGYFLKILYVHTKESGPLGGRASGTLPRSANCKVNCIKFRNIRVSHCHVD